MKFFMGTDGHYYRTSDIVSIGPERVVDTTRGARNVHRFQMDKAGEAEIWAHDLDEILADPGRIIPAGAGIYVLHYDVHTADPDGMTKAVVIGWRVSTDGSLVEPITADGVNDGLTSAVAVLMPDGSVVSPNNAVWSDVASWVADQQPSE